MHCAIYRENMQSVENIVSALSRDEMEHVMKVLKRDRDLQQSEDVRVAGLKLDLVREKRRGALVAGRRQHRQESRCARCLESLDWADWWDNSKARCTVCKHLVCKKCRVHDWKQGWRDARTTIVSSEAEEEATAARLRTSSAPVLPSQSSPTGTVAALGHHNSATTYPVHFDRPKVVTSDASTQTDFSFPPRLTANFRSDCPLCGNGSERSSRNSSATENSEDFKMSENVSTGGPNLKAAIRRPVTKSIDSIPFESENKAQLPVDRAKDAACAIPSFLRQAVNFDKTQKSSKPPQRTQSYCQPRSHSIAAEAPLISSLFLAGSILTRETRTTEKRSTSQPSLRDTDVAAASLEKLEPLENERFSGRRPLELEAMVAAPTSKEKKAASRAGATRIDESTKAIRSDLASDYDPGLNPFLSEYDPKLNPFLNSCDDVDRDEDSANKHTSAKREPQNPFLDSSSEQDEKENKPAPCPGRNAELVTSTRRSLSNAEKDAALKFLALAGVTSSQNRRYSTPASPNSWSKTEQEALKPSLITLGEARRKLDFTSPLSHISESGPPEASTHAAAVNAPSESRLSSSFSGLASTLNKPFAFLKAHSGQNGPGGTKRGRRTAGSLLDRGMDSTAPLAKRPNGAGGSDAGSDVANDDANVDGKREKASQGTSLEKSLIRPRSRELVLQDDELRRKTDTLASVDTQMVTLADSKPASEKTTDPIATALNIIPPTPKPELDEPEQDPVFARLDEFVSYRRRSSDQSDTFSVASSLVSTLVLAASPLSASNSPAASEGSSTETGNENHAGVCSDYSSEASYNARSDADYGDFEDSDAPSPARGPRKTARVFFGCSAGNTDETHVPLRRKGTRDSGYMTPDDALKSQKVAGAQSARARSQREVSDATWPVSESETTENNSTPTKKDHTSPTLSMSSQSVVYHGTGSVVPHSSFAALSHDDTPLIVDEKSYLLMRGDGMPEKKNVLQARESAAWICKVCYKTIELQRKTGDWFFRASLAKKTKYKQRVQIPVASLKAAARAPSPCAARANRTQGKRSRSQPDHLLRSKLVANVNSSPVRPNSSNPNSPSVSRRSTMGAIPPRDSKSDPVGRNLSGIALYQAVSQEAARKQWTRRQDRGTAAEQVRTALQKHVPGGDSSACWCLLGPG